MNAGGGFNSRIDTAEEKFNDLNSECMGKGECINRKMKIKRIEQEKRI